MSAVHVKLTSIDGKPVDGPEWITTEDGEHRPVVGPLTAMSREYIADSKRWFPALHGHVRDAVVHFGLGLAGEAGEVANLVKKYNRGSLDLAAVTGALPHELADVIAYALDLGAALGIDIDRALAEKRAICEQRWGSR